MSTLTNSGGLQSTVARFDPVENIWSKLGDLNVAREGHGAIQVENEFIVVGGTGIMPTESCKFNRQSISCITRQPQVNFYYYPELMHLNFI